MVKGFRLYDHLLSGTDGPIYKKKNYGRSGVVFFGVFLFLASKNAILKYRIHANSTSPETKNTSSWQKERPHERSE